MSKISKPCTSSLKLCAKNCRLFFPDTVQVKATEFVHWLNNIVAYTVTVSRKKRTNFETVQLKIKKIDFDDIWQRYSNYSRIQFASVFVQVCFFINFSSFKPDTENNTNFDALSIYEYFCQMSSKSIIVISSYNVSKLVRFFLRQSVVAYISAE